MGNEIISKKLEQIGALLSQLQSWLDRPFAQFEREVTLVRSAERNFQLIVDLASDINTQLLIAKSGKTPDTYKESFAALGRAGIIDKKLSENLKDSAGLRNIIVHEYDLEEDLQLFYKSAIAFLPAYREYIKQIQKYITD